MTSAVGPLVLPVPAGLATDQIADPAANALLTWLGRWLNTELNPRLANLAGTPGTACPTANRFAFDPLDPRGHQHRLPVPALFCWWTSKSKIEPAGTTLLTTVRVRDLTVLYCWEDLPKLEDMNRRAGMHALVDAVFWKASDQCYHPDDESTLRTMAAEVDQLDFQYQGGEPGRMSIEKDATQKDRSFPCIRGQWVARERVDQDQQDETDVDAMATDITHDGVPMMSRYLMPPDGSEQEP